MGRALALAQHVPLPDGRDRIAVDIEDARMGFVWAELKALAQDRHEAHRRPAVEELGALDLGPFADRDFVSPATAAQARKAMNSGTTDRDELAADDGAWRKPLRRRAERHPGRLRPVSLPGHLRRASALFYGGVQSLAVTWCARPRPSPHQR